MPDKLINLLAPAFLLSKLPVAPESKTLSLPSLPVSRAPVVETVAVTVPSYTLLLAVTPLIAVIVAGVIVATAVPLVSE